MNVALDLAEYPMPATASHWPGWRPCAGFQVLRKVACCCGDFLPTRMVMMVMAAIRMKAGRYQPQAIVVDGGAKPGS